MRARSLAFFMALFLAGNTTNAYEIGDTIDPEITEKLNIEHGKPAVIEFFASWCASCAKEIPEIHDFIREDKKNIVQVIGVDIDEELDDGKKFQSDLNISFPVYDDTDQRVVEAFGPIGMPALYYVIDNKVVRKRIGPINHIDDQIREDLGDLGIEL